MNFFLDVKEDWYTIEPMMLVPFVENAFKHGVGMIEKPEINIELSTKGNMLCFSVHNKFNPGSKEIKDKTSGIGLTNVKRRLNLLYPHNHQLVITADNDWFSVSLQLKLH